jgi:hypothetical protein
MPVRTLPPPTSAPALAPDAKRALVGRLARAFAQIVVNDLAKDGLALEVLPPGATPPATRTPTTQTRRER